LSWTTRRSTNAPPLSFIRNAGHTLAYLPADSPDLNPVERKRAHLKSIRKQTAAAIHNFFKIELFYMA
jgi:transposase